MAGTATIGSLRAVLGLDRADFMSGLTAAQKELRKAGREFEKVGRQIGDIGKSMTTMITLPVIGLGAAVIKTAGDFEAAMGRVGISTGAAGKQMQELSALARQIGRDTVFSASEAADAMDMLAKAGLSTTDILKGAAAATVNLAAAAGTDLDPAASAITDTMSQFKIAVADLPMVVNQITGAVNESKLDFSDFSDAIGQAGGVAGALGVSFKDFNAALAATSPLFSSGSDAGTSFKTFLQTMVPTTTKAATAMQEYGLSFFDAAGKMKPMAEIAEMLRTQLGGLSDSAKTDVLKDIFGTDAMRTAIGLMQQGSAGLENIAKKIAETDAAAQAAKRMEGFNGQMQQLGGAFEEVAIAIGQSGILKLMTDVVKAIGDVMMKISTLRPVALQIGLVFAGIAAAVGPVLVVVGSLVSAWGALSVALASGGVLAGLAGFAAVAVPIVAGVAAIAGAIYLMRDDLLPVFEQFREAVMEALGPYLPDIMRNAQAAFAAIGPAISAVAGVIGPILAALTKAFLYAFGPILVTMLKVMAAQITGAFQIISNVLRFVSALLTGDWQKAWNAAGSVVGSILNTVGRTIDAVFPGALRNITAMVDGVKRLFTVDLFGVFRTAVGKVKEVGDSFFNLYDRVVGHSYVPDMVDEIGQQIARLDAVLVRPVRQATKNTADAFRDMQEQARTALEGLLSDKAKLDLELRRDTAKYDEWLKAGVIDRPTYDGAMAERSRRYRADSAGIDGEGIEMPKVPDLQEGFPEVERINKMWSAMQDRIRDSRDSFADAFSRGMESAVRGDWQGVLESVVGKTFQDSLRDVGKWIFDKMGGSSPGGFSLGNVGSIFSSISSMFSGLPKFANGGTIGAGGSGGIDSQLVQFWKSPSEQVDIYKPGSAPNGGGGNSYHFSGNLMTPEFWNQIQSEVSAGEGRSNQWAATNVPGLAQSQTAKQQQHAVGRRRR